MILEPRFTDDVADLPTHKFGPSSLTWWGIIGFMVIEGAVLRAGLRRLFLPDGPRAGLAARGPRRRRTCSPAPCSRSSSCSAKFPNTMIKKAAQRRRRPGHPRADAGHGRDRRRPAGHSRVRVQQPQLPLDRQRLWLDHLGAAAPARDAHPHRLGRHGRALAR